MEKTVILYAEPQYCFEHLCRAADPDAALFYAYLAANGGKALPSAAADVLRIPGSRLKRAAELLVMHGIAVFKGDMPVRRETPADPAEISYLRENNDEFSGLCHYLEGALGRILTRRELETLCAVHFELNLPCDLLMLMINYTRSRRKLSVRELERLSYEWHDADITTYDRAEKHIAALAEKNSRAMQIMRILGLFDRRPSSGEREFLDKWVSCGFDDELIKLAYERMMMRTHEVSFQYLNAILERWQAAGIKTAEQAKFNDKKPAEAAASESQITEQFNQKRHQRELRQQKRLAELLKKSPDFEENEKQMRLCASRTARASGSQREVLQKERDLLTRRRTELLASLGHPADWLDNVPDCPLCQDRGYIGTKMCSCLKKALADGGVSK